MLVLFLLLGKFLRIEFEHLYELNFVRVGKRRINSFAVDELAPAKPLTSYARRRESNR